jgi:hypothetical protein
MKKHLTFSNFLTVVSIICGVVAYFKLPMLMGNASLATGIAAFGAGLL